MGGGEEEEGRADPRGDAVAAGGVDAQPVVPVLERPGGAQLEPQLAAQHPAEAGQVACAEEAAGVEGEVAEAVVVPAGHAPQGGVGLQQRRRGLEQQQKVLREDHVCGRGERRAEARERAPRTVLQDDDVAVVALHEEAVQGVLVWLREPRRPRLPLPRRHARPLPVVAVLKARQVPLHHRPHVRGVAVLRDVEGVGLHVRHALQARLASGRGSPAGCSRTPRSQGPPCRTRPAGSRGQRDAQSRIGRRTSGTGGPLGLMTGIGRCGVSGNWRDRGGGEREEELGREERGKMTGGCDCLLLESRAGRTADQVDSEKQPGEKGSQDHRDCTEAPTRNGALPLLQIRRGMYLLRRGQKYIEPSFC